MWPSASTAPSKVSWRVSCMGLGIVASPSLEVRLAAFEEGRHTLAVVFGEEQLGQAAGDPAAELVPVGVERLAQAPLHPLRGARRGRRDLRGEAERRAHELGWPARPRQEPKSQLLECIDNPA